MKALEKRCVFIGDKHYMEKKWKQHRERLKQVKNFVDTSEPVSRRKGSPTKQSDKNKALKEHINRENYLITRRIFAILEGRSALADHINDTSHLDSHPGTMNFKQRLFEAQRIHERNMVLASRLDSIKPYYKMSDMTVVQYRGQSPRSPRKPQKTKFMKELEYTLQMANRLPLTEQEADQMDMGIGYYQDFKFADFYREKIRQRKGKPQDESSAPRPRNLLLEYSKVQNDRVLDVAVVKEPFKDRYIIFGMDVDNGQRFELRLTSEDVSNIVDGDILVTSVDNVEVWMALLNKVTLQPVDTFQQMLDEVDPDESAFPPPPDIIAPHAPDAFSRPSVASGHRQHRAVSNSQSVDTRREQPDVLDSFAVGSIVSAPSEPSIPDMFSRPATVDAIASHLTESASGSTPVKKKGVQLTVEDEEDGGEGDGPKAGKASNWKPPTLTPKPPSNRKQAGNSRAGGKKSITAANTSHNAVVTQLPPSQVKPGQAPANPVAPTAAPNGARPSMAGKTTTTTTTTTTTPRKPVAPTGNPTAHNVRKPVQPSTKPSPSSPRNGASTKKPSVQRGDAATAATASSGRAPPVVEEVAQPIGDEVRRVVLEHQAVQAQATLAVDLVISHAMDAVQSLSARQTPVESLLTEGRQRDEDPAARSAAATAEEEGEEDGPAAMSSPVRDLDREMHDVSRTVDGTEEDYLGASFEEVSTLHQESPRQHNNEDDRPVEIEGEETVEAEEERDDR